MPLIVDLLRELPERRRARGATMGPFAAAAFVLLVVGGGTAYALSWTIDRITSGESVRAQRLGQPVEGTLGPLSLKVEKVEVTDNFTKVAFTAVNRGAMAAKVSVVDSCRLVTGEAEFRLDGLFDVLREPFFLDVPGGATVRGTFAFPGTPRPGPDHRDDELRFGVVDRLGPAVAGPGLRGPAAARGGRRTRAHGLMWNLRPPRGVEGV
nr:hypothetical protein GCM10017745_33480 [Saccharothrix mutabilis subsp. capreolus]